PGDRTGPPEGRIAVRTRTRGEGRRAVPCVPAPPGTRRPAGRTRRRGRSPPRDRRVVPCVPAPPGTRRPAGRTRRGTAPRSRSAPQGRRRGPPDRRVVREGDRARPVRCRGRDLEQIGRASWRGGGAPAL